MAAENWAGARKGIAAGLARERTADLLLQDAVCRLKLDRDVRGARASLESGIESNPEDARLPDSLAWSFASQKQAAAGVARLRELSDRHPNSAALRMVLGKWLARTGNPEEARNALEAALKLNPRLVEADLAVADVDQRTGKIPEARKRLESLLKAHPENAGLRLKLAALEDQAGNIPQAIDEYRKVLAADPNNLLALNNLAFRLANDRRQPDEALKFAQQAKELAPENPFIDDTLGWAFYQKGLYTNALRHLESAVRRQATAQRQYHLAMAYLKSGDTKRGETALRAALEQDPNLPEAKLAREQLRRSADR
jgi:tetratricopeptide (TPR) repeat protein